MADSEVFYKTLAETFKQAEERVKEYGLDNRLHMHVFAASKYDFDKTPGPNLEISLSFDSHTNGSVRGREFWVVFDELLRRHGFDQGQKAKLMLAGPVVADD